MLTLIIYDFKNNQFLLLNTFIFLQSLIMSGSYGEDIVVYGCSDDEKCKNPEDIKRFIAMPIYSDISVWSEQEKADFKDLCIRSFGAEDGLSCYNHARSYVKANKYSITAAKVSTSWKDAAEAFYQFTPPEPLIDLCEAKQVARRKLCKLVSNCPVNCSEDTNHVVMYE